MAFDVPYFDTIILSLTQFNALVSLFLFIQVARHYVFLNQATVDNALVKWLKRVFIADVLMSISVGLFNLAPQFTGGVAEYAEYEGLRIVLKLLQGATVSFALWANYGLARHGLSIGRK